MSSKRRNPLSWRNLQWMEMLSNFNTLQPQKSNLMTSIICLADQSFCIMCVYLTMADCVCAGAGWWSQETEAGHQAGAGGGLDDSGELRTALPRAHWEETPSETELCLSEDLSPSPIVTSSFRLSEMTSSLAFFSASSCPKIFLVLHPHCCIN